MSASLSNVSSLSCGSNVISSLLFDCQESCEAPTTMYRSLQVEGGRVMKKKIAVITESAHEVGVISANTRTSNSVMLAQAPVPRKTHS